MELLGGGLPVGEVDTLGKHTGVTALSHQMLETVASP